MCTCHLGMGLCSSLLLFLSAFISCPLCTPCARPWGSRSGCDAIPAVQAHSLAGEAGGISVSLGWLPGVVTPDRMREEEGWPGEAGAEGPGWRTQQVH